MRRWSYSSELLRTDLDRVTFGSGLLVQVGRAGAAGALAWNGASADVTG